MSARYPHPICRLTVAGDDITAAVMKRLVSISLTDNRGLDTDALEIQLSDHDGRLAIPPHRAEIRLWLGWSDTGLVYKGAYAVDETEHTGAPDTLTIRAHSADLREQIKAKRERSWHQTSIGAVVQAIAGEHGLGNVIGEKLAGIAVPHIDQANESDMHLLSRLAAQHDAIAQVKDGKLFFTPIGQGTTAKGTTLPHVTLTRADGDSHRFLQADRNTHTGARAFYNELNSALKESVIAGAEANLKDIRHLYTDKAGAQAAADAEWSRMQRGSATLSYTLARGRPDLIPELTYSLHGIKPEISAIRWLGGNVRHSFTDAGYTTSLELETDLDG
ncbi:contractile injection system protein, VgrG/Pvc8 family [Stutzerimonas kunmingensis]|uniref:contractile injection system protein, VgrG/Pvc8 family n=1 Tax=Stutzerimonas kunmingensis TaxID=1211807 RepID=UPI0028B21129|nr:contractile injection system protein, VgrG/Pvc8 family [Stutzerimonas kunmingensis]